jgi:LacI family transcriptional regulator
MMSYRTREGAPQIIVTVKEIAELAGVSIGTVDRVLYKRGRVSEATRARIEDIIEKYQFTPNPIARRLKRNRSYQFTALMPRRDQDAGYWGQALAGIQRAGAEIAPLGVQTEIIEFDRYSQDEFRAAAAAVLEQKPDGLIFSPIMPDRTKPFVDKIQQVGIPIIFFDADIPGTDPLCAIGQDSFRGGYLAGRLMHLFAGKIKAPVAVLDAHGEDYHIIRRRDGFLRYAGEYRIPTLVQEYSDYKGTEISVREISLFLRKNPELTGIFITNCMAHRVAEAAEKLKKPLTLKTASNTNRRFAQDLLIIGYDLIPNNRIFLQEGRINAIISQRPEDQGRDALLAMYRFIVLEQKIPARIEIPLDIYFKENIPE